MAVCCVMGDPQGRALRGAPCRHHCSLIGVFDSGLGGLSVLDALASALPHADFIYFADSAHVPYGNKPEAFVRERVLSIGDELVRHGCDLLVVACNTATVAAVEALRAAHPGIPVVGIEPGVKPAAATTKSGRIAVLATEATAKSARLARLVANHALGVAVDIVPCPGWATHVEQLDLADPALALDVQARLAPVLAAGADRLVLGCTHYSFLRPLLEAEAAGRAELVEVSAAVARQAIRLYGTRSAGNGRVMLQASARPERLAAALPALGLQALAARTTGLRMV